MADDAVFDIRDFPVHLGLGARAFPLDRFDGTPAWYERYGAEHAADGNEGRLVSMFSFDSSWDTWEMHPEGDELVLCVQGSIVLHQEIEGVDTVVELQAGQAVVNPSGTWHTADVDAPCAAVFVTAGRGTQVRPR
jgi:uncharacterized cupin superfamily protein